MNSIGGGIFGLMGTGLSAGVNYLINEENNREAESRESAARYGNYLLGEQAAKNADKRTRQLYNDLYSPKAQLEQLKAAGLSPSLFYGDGGGISGQAGAQGTGAAGVSPQVFGMSPIDLSELGLIAAQTHKAEAEAQNIQQDTKLSKIEADMKELEKTYKNIDFSVLTAGIQNQNGEMTSLYEIASNCYTYDNFLSRVRDAAMNGGDQLLLQATSTEQGQETLRAIYQANNKFERDIAVLSNEKVNATFYEQVTNELKKQDFAKLNAKEAVAQLRQNIEAANLAQEQKSAWNRMLDKLERSSGTTIKDIVIILSMIVNNAMTNWKVQLPKKEK